MAINPTGSGAATGVGGGGVVRPLYGVFIHDQVAALRANLNVTLSDLKAGIKAGSPGAKQIVGDGKLEGIEVKEAKSAAVQLGKALSALKPVFGNGEVNDKAARVSLGRANSDPAHPIAMYGVFLADDLKKYQTDISNNIATIQQGLANKTLSGDAATEATKALKNLQSALKVLGGISF